MRAFRNLADADLALPAAGAVIVGPNGHGKTSLIEAALYCEVFRSFRGAADREVGRFGADGFHVAVQACGHTGVQDVTAGYDARVRQKKVTVDGTEPARLQDAIGIVRGVVLSPSDVALVAGGPRERRRYLDVLLSLTVPGYVAALGTYRRALRHRARATLGESPVWERLLAGSGAAIVAAREAWVAAWRERYAALCEAIGERGTGGPRDRGTGGPRGRGTEGSVLAYAASVEGGAEALVAAFERTRSRDLARGRTSVGPHRDEVRLGLGGHELRTYGSAGQQRTAALALRFCEAETLRAATGEPVTICLDDAFAELDAERSRRLAALVADTAAAGSQVIAAVPKHSDVPDTLGALPTWQLREGRIT